MRHSLNVLNEYDSPAILFCIENACIVTPTGMIKNGAVTISNGQIIDIGNTASSYS